MPGASLALFADLGACHVQKSSVTICVLPTPSGWRATTKTRKHTLLHTHFYPRPPGGGRHRSPLDLRKFRADFYPRPPGGGRRLPPQLGDRFRYFYPRPPGGGRHTAPRLCRPCSVFLSTPSGWRATKAYKELQDWVNAISIHALRVEGDCRYRLRRSGVPYFYPRPPGGGRHLSHFVRCADISYFYPRPPGGGRPSRFNK